jgi:group I intron endonuclease
MHIYKWTHIASGRCYIGQSTQEPNRRRLEHISHSRYSERTYHFHNALRKYGIEAFTWEVLAHAKDIAELNLLEKQYIQKFDSIDNGFNIRNGGNNKLHSIDSKLRMSEAQKLAHAKRKKEGRSGFIRKNNTYGWKWTEEQKEKLRGRSYVRGMTWKIINGKRTWLEVA